jgi:hypothetical protein
VVLRVLRVLRALMVLVDLMGLVDLRAPWRLSGVSGI